MRFPIPPNLNGAKLVQELSTKGIPAKVVAYEGEVEVTTEADRSAVRPVVEAHTGGPAQEQANRTEIETKAREALVANRTYVGLAAPTNAQNAAQLKSLTRQINGILRVILNDFGGTD